MLWNNTILQAIGPICPRVGHKGKAPVSLTLPKVGLIPITPEKEAGIRTEPPPSVPKATGVIPVPTETPEPAEEPPE